VRPVVKREVVRFVQAEYDYSQRRACRLIGSNRRTARHVSKRPEDTELREAMKELAEQKPAWGYRMLHGALRLRGVVVNHKRVHRLYCEEKLALRKKSKKHIKCEKRGIVEDAVRPGQRWTMDFVHDALSDGRGFRTLNLTDTFTRQCLGQEVDSSLSSERVVRLLDRVVVEHGRPEEIQVDNGPEFRSHALDQWAYQNKVKLVFIEPGKPTQNGHLESFNGRFRAECLDQEWFVSLDEARRVIETWRISYNSQRPHSSLGYLPPDTWAGNQKRKQQNLTL
jgi:putative transposase